MIEPAAAGEEELRRWLTLLRRPDQLAAAGAGELLKRHRRTPSSSPLETGRMAADLLLQSIERLRPQEAASRDQQLPYLVLKTCFVDGRKLTRAAMELGMSERQLTRERTRAIGLLRAELELTEAAESGYLPELIPAIGDFVARPAVARLLQQQAEAQRLVHVHGPPGIGKTALVAELAAETTRRRPVLWLRFRQDVNDSLGALLYELGEYLRAEGSPRLAGYLADALPAIDFGVATRMALQGLSDRPRLCVLDDFHVVADVAGIRGLIDELTGRVRDLQVITTSRYREGAPPLGGDVPVPPFSQAETAQLLTQLGAGPDEATAAAVQRWTGGIPHLIKLAAAWIKTADADEIDRGMDVLNDQEEVQEFLLSYITELLDSDDRDILEAASIFQERFTDDALAHVAARTRGEVQDASRRLVRVYIATRGRDGNCSFFHTSVRDFVYARLAPARRGQLHERAARWYGDQGRPDQARHHARLGGPG